MKYIYYFENEQQELEKIFENYPNWLTRLKSYNSNMDNGVLSKLDKMNVIQAPQFALRMEGYCRECKMIVRLSMTGVCCCSLHKLILEIPPDGDYSTSMDYELGASGKERWKDGQCIGYKGKNGWILKG